MNSPKDSFSAALDKSIQQEVDAMLANQDPNQNKLLSYEAQRAKLEQEIRQSIDLSEFGKHVTTANRILSEEGDQYLEKEEYDSLMKGLNHLKAQISNLVPTELNDDSLKSVFTLSQPNLSSILKVGIAKFSNGLLPESLSIFAFLSAISPQEADYWYRLGLVAQRCELYDIAIRAFALTSNLAPDFPGAHIYAAECYLTTGKFENAVAEVNEIKKILETNEVDEEWKTRVHDIENLILASNPAQSH